MIDRLRKPSWIGVIELPGHGRRPHCWPAHRPRRRRNAHLFHVGHDGQAEDARSRRLRHARLRNRILQHLFPRLLHIIGQTYLVSLDDQQRPFFRIESRQLRIANGAVQHRIVHQAQTNRQRVERFDGDSLCRNLLRRRLHETEQCRM